MIKRIKSSLWLKIFLMLAALLFSVSILLYGIVMTVMPASYENLADKKIKSNTGQLVQQLENSTLDEVPELLYNFCIDNDAAVCLEGGDTKLSYGTSDVLSGTDTEEQSARLLKLKTMLKLNFLEVIRLTCLRFPRPDKSFRILHSLFGIFFRLSV